MMVLGKTRKALGACSVIAVIGIMYSQFSGELRLSPAGAEIIGNAEGCMATPYKCPADVLTVGIGSTEYSGQKIEPNKKYTNEEIAYRWKTILNLPNRALIDTPMAEHYHNLCLMLWCLLRLTMDVAISKTRQCSA